MTFFSQNPYKKRTVIHRRPHNRPSIFFGRAKDSSSSKSAPGAVNAVVSNSSSSPEKSNSISPPHSASTAPTSYHDSTSNGLSAASAALSKLRSHSPIKSGAFSGSTVAPTGGSTETTLSRHKSARSTSSGNGIPVQQADPDPIKPSIATIEAAAAAKIFFETHFNELQSSKASSRQGRRDDLEERLKVQGASKQEREDAIKKWLRAETDHLRQVRVWKGHSMVRRNSKGISLAGYEVIRVLGKGSFGVVRLVREKEMPLPKAPRLESESDIERLDGKGEPQRKRPRPSDCCRQVFAMKVIRKSEMLRNCQEGHLRAERDFLVASENSRWVVPLIASFQDNTNLYLVMDYMVGGDFLGLLVRYDVLDERVSQFYVAQMILCVEEAHKMNWIHRDVKPDNFLITSSGHLKISDFGLAFDGHWAHNQSYFSDKRYSLLQKFGVKVQGDEYDEEDERKKLEKQKAAGLGVSGIPWGLGRMQPKPSMFTIKEKYSAGNAEASAKEENPLSWMNRNQMRRLAKSVVGTSQYMAPEVIRGEEYDGRCDWWSIGIILYECLYGATPFFAQDRKETKERIVAHRQHLFFPPEQRYSGEVLPRRPLEPVSYNAIELITLLLTDKEDRLSSPRYKENNFHPQPFPRHQRHRSFGMRGTGAGFSYRTSSVPQTAAYGEPSAQRQHPRVNFVFPDDAVQIKAHPFFCGIRWERLHLEPPPWVPQIRHGQDLTKYFDDEHQILGSSPPDTHSSSACDCATTAAEPAKTPPATKEDCCRHPQINCVGLGYGGEGQYWANANANAAAANAKAKGKHKAKERERKRPRDKLLRDPHLKAQVLEARKKGAFIRYTYRRPKEVMRTAVLGMV
ncbi:serine/threonine-protein kinase cbk1 [Phyllosticta capitalensis]